MLEHIYDLDQAFQAMDAVLRIGGSMIHEVDFRDHAIFSSYNLHPLTFLTFSAKTWRMASNKLGAPNRRLSNYYRSLFNQYRYDYKLINILAVGSDNKFHEEKLKLGLTHDQRAIDLVNSIRNRLNKEFKNLPKDDLLTSGIFFTATKNR